MRRSLRVLTALTILMYLAGCAAIGIAASESALRPPRGRWPTDAMTYARHVAHEASGARATGVTVSVREVTLDRPDGVTLRAWSFETPRPDAPTVLLLHGVSDSRRGMMGLAALFLRDGYRVLAPDARGHGVSGGLATYGVREADDVRAWAGWAAARTSGACVYGLGASMGGAHLLQASAGARVFCAVATESSFSSFREVAFDRIGQRIGAGPWAGRWLLRPVIEFGLVYTAWRYGVDLRQADPAAAIARTPTPVLLMHGTADTNIPPRHAERLHAANPHATLWLVKDAAHVDASLVAPDEYADRVLTFFASHARAARATSVPLR